MTFVSRTVRFTFPTYLAAAEALLVVLEDARTTQTEYRFTGLSPEAIVSTGLTLTGDIDAVSEKVSLISGANKHSE